MINHVLHPRVLSFRKNLEHHREAGAERKKLAGRLVATPKSRDAHRGKLRRNIQRLRTEQRDAIVKLVFGGAVIVGLTAAVAGLVIKTLAESDVSIAQQSVSAPVVAGDPE